jgi:hypothetical protein
MLQQKRKKTSKKISLTSHNLFSYVDHRCTHFPEKEKEAKNNTPKVHDLVHFTQFIERFGHPAFWDCRTEERKHIDAVKGPLRGNIYTSKSDESIVLQV